MKEEEKEQLFPLGKLFSILTKEYIGILSDKLKEIPLNRYYYPFWLISQRSGEITPKMLAKSLHMDKVGIVRIIDYLEKEEFLVRNPNPEDRRSHLLAITEKGKPYTKIIENAIRETDEDFLKNIPIENQMSFSNQLIGLTDKMKSIKGEGIALFYDKININTND